MLVKGFYKWQQIIVKTFIQAKTLKKKYYLFEKKN